ncbi:MAG: ABC transporter permease [Clostridia bacterium]|nr:ABC transporter permease [Clostridia bacterium]
MDNNELKNNPSLEDATKEINKGQEKYDLNDDRRVKVLTPGALVRKRFFRNKVAVVGLVILIFMFAFSFIGGILSPYSQDQFFYRDDIMQKEVAGVSVSKDFRYEIKDVTKFPPLAQANVAIATAMGENKAEVDKTVFDIVKVSDDFYYIERAGELVAYRYKDIISTAKGDDSFSFEFKYEALKAKAEAASGFTFDGKDYILDEEGDIILEGNVVGYVSRYIVNAVMADFAISRELKEEMIETVEKGGGVVDYTPKDEKLEEGEKVQYFIEYDPVRDYYIVKQEKSVHKYDTYSWPGKGHILGTDRYGMDMLTRLMYGGRVSLLIGFIVVIIETVLGVIMGGIAGFFGGWVDNLIMRLVDVFYCIPSMPIIIIIGAAMDAQAVDPTIRMIYLMLILGFLGWAGIARLVRGQILSLREQEYMTAAEATGLKTSSRIFKHLIPNVIPQLIVNCTMSLGGVILTEATLSFLGLGVKFPFASWGNIINDVNNTFVLTNYWFIWIPAGVLLLLTVLAFNLVGDGLRDAFDPRMKR